MQELQFPERERQLELNQAKKITLQEMMCFVSNTGKCLMEEGNKI
jgi:hypothetical protein